MKVDEWLDLFRQNRGKSLFSLSDLVLLTGDQRPSLSVQLSRLVASGVIERPARGWYANPFAFPSDEEVAMVIREPSYLSMEYALSREGILSQQVQVRDEYLVAPGEEALVLGLPEGGRGDGR